MAFTYRTSVLGKIYARHLLSRATFGVSKEVVDYFATLTPQEAVDILFQQIPEPMPPLDPVTGSTWIDSAPVTDEDDNLLQGYFKKWWLGNMLGAGWAPEIKLPAMTREKIVFFLHTHFTTIQSVVNSSRALYFQNVLFRKFAFDSFSNAKFNYKNLVVKICLDNAMMRLLDGRLNVKGRPNENFAREFFELYTLGKGLPGQIAPGTEPGDYTYFTESDIQAAARIFSGYDFDNTFSNIDSDTELPIVKVKLNSGLIAAQHDNGEKQFSHRFSNAVVIPNPLLLSNEDPTEESMHDEIRQLTEILFSNEETARNICRKIYRFYVYHQITPETEATIISSLVEILKQNGYKLDPVIKALFTSDHFYNSATADSTDDFPGSLIKSPLELVGNTLHFFDHEFPDPNIDTSGLYDQCEELLGKFNLQGLDLLNPFDVAGYDAYFQYPLFNRNWISANTLGQRYKFIYDYMVPSGDMEMAAISLDLYDFVKEKFSAIALDPDELIRELITYLFCRSEEGTEITTDRINYFRTQFLKLGTGLPQGAVAFWQFNWQNAEESETSKEDVRGMLQDLFNALLQSPEYQLF